jgi:nitroreductase
MLLLTGMDTRSSAVRLVEPGPGRAELRRILAAGVRAPDHGRLQPWRFRVLEGDARRVLGEALEDFARRSNPVATTEQLAAARGKALRAPTVIVVSARITYGHKVPGIEQQLAVAAAVQNMLLAAHALAFGAVWKTGAAAYDAGVKRLLGLEPDDHIVAFLYLGTAEAVAPVRPANLDECVRWE